MPVGHIDINFFEGQARRRFNDRILDKTPYVVANCQHDRIVTLNEAAKKSGLTRDFKLHEARRFVPNLKIIKMPINPYTGKPDRTQLETASEDFQNCIKKIRNSRGWDIPIEFGSMDEAYLNLSFQVDQLINQNPRPYIHCAELHWNSYFELPVSDYSLDQVRKNTGKIKKYLAINHPEIYYSSFIMSYFMREIKYQEGYQVSVGIGKDRFESKLAGDINGGNSLTFLTHEALDRVSENLDINKIVGLKGTTGCRLKNYFQVETVAQLRKISPHRLLQFFQGNTEKTWEIRQKIFGELPHFHKDNFIVSYENELNQNP